MPLPGDEVAGIFHPDSAEDDSRIVELDYAGYARSAVSVGQILTKARGGVSLDTLQDSQSTSEVEQPSIKGVLRQFNRVLIVDDHEPFLRGLTQFMNDLGCETVAWKSSEEAWESLWNSEGRFDLALIDVHLRGSDDYEGLALAESLAVADAPCRIVAMSAEDLDLTDPRPSRYADLMVSGFILKPFGMRELFAVLASAAGGQPRPLRDVVAYSSSAQHPSGNSVTASPSPDQLSGVCTALAEMVGADAVALFSVHPITYVVELLASAGPRPFPSGPLYKLNLSPVRDAAIDGEDIFTLRASAHRPKHRWLLRAYRYESCVGVPVSLNLASSGGHALFAFHRDDNHFNPYDRHAVWQAAQAIGHILRTRAMEAELRQMKPFDLMGKVYGSMAHDLSSEIPDEFSFARLQKAIAANDQEGARDEVASLLARSIRATGIVETFREMARGQREAVADFDIRKAVTEAVRIYGVKVKDLGTRCETGSDPVEPCPVHMRKSGLNQIMFNLMLNAAQQIRRLRTVRRTPGEIRIDVLRVANHETGEWAVVLVHDNGPGIHRRDFERVFDIHFTTKEDGCGMGLHICGEIAKSVAKNGRTGSVRVLRSILLGGTTFELRLPL
jgi:signal transduction histidine kinase/DNA-binding NarL/FixJ family response regulator